MSENQRGAFFLLNTKTFLMGASFIYIFTNFRKSLTYFKKLSQSEIKAFLFFPFPNLKYTP